MLPILGPRLGRGLCLAVLIALAPLAPVGVLGSSQQHAASAAVPGPPTVTARTARVEAVRCLGSPRHSAHPPVLLVPGTGMTAEENWGPSYRPLLQRRGHSVCTVELPGYATHDVQTSAEYVAHAIRTVHRRAGRQVSVLGQSQGAFLPHLALRVWPDLSRRVDDVVGLGGVYDAGSTELTRRCIGRCLPVFHQLASGSRLLRHLSRRPLPAGPSYTNIGAVRDATITPQPTANRQPGARAMTIQDVCPGRVLPDGMAHALLVGDAVAGALVLDALHHHGPAAPGRVPAATCDEEMFPGFDQDGYLSAVDLIGARIRHSSRSEPAVRCYLRLGCRDVSQRGRMLRGIRISEWRRVVRVRARVVTPGRVMLRLGGRKVRREVEPGRVSVRIARPRRAARLHVQTEPEPYRRWATEHSRPVAGRR